MKTLTIFYDPRCGLCARFRVWLEAQPKRVSVEFLGYDTPEALRRFPGLGELGADRDVVVLADDGRWWQGSAAWLTCLWTTANHHKWAFHLADPMFQPFVRKAVHLLSENRLTLSRLLKLRTRDDVADTLRNAPEPTCAGGTCNL
jgi:predicted DCC family thiol-disulfide oxidoreductase YuxK